MNKETFDILILVARPAAGKSEVIDYLKRTEILERINRFHIGATQEFDDFPYLWRWFEIDHNLSEMGYPRRFTDPEGYFDQPNLWDLLIRLLCFDYQKIIRENPDFHDNHTAIIEFSRGKEHGGYQAAFQQIDESILKRAAILYINVSWEESLRKNRKRFNPDRPGSILEHALPDSKLEKLYFETDWDDFTASSEAYVTVKNINVPYVVFENNDDVTSGDRNGLGTRLESNLKTLWQRFKESQPAD